VIKRFKITERNSFEFRMTMLNVLNHQNFASVDPAIDDAGQHSAGTGFGDPSTTGSAFPGSNGATRRINFGVNLPVLTAFCLTWPASSLAGFFFLVHPAGALTRK